MTSNLLLLELSGLIQDSKRKFPELKTAAEKSLNELKSLSNTSDNQLAADLRRRPTIVKPFLIACSTRNSKLAGNAIVCLQRLVVCNGLPREALKDVLGALRDASSLGQDVQLRVLQVLPSLLQNYSSQLRGQLLATAIEVCSLLLTSKNGVVSSTAAATLQQLVVSIYGKVAEEDERLAEDEPARDLLVDETIISVRVAAFDAYYLLSDLSLLIEGQKPQYLYGVSISADIGLELVEAVLLQHSETIRRHSEAIHTFRSKIVPFVLSVLAEQSSFSITLRVLRLLPLILINLLNVMVPECEMVLNLLNHMLDPEAAPLWKRILSMEVFRALHNEPALIRQIYTVYDEQDGNKNIIVDHIGLMVRLAAEKPSVIGLGSQSSVPSNSSQLDDIAEEQAALQAEGFTGTIGAGMSLKSSESPGLSTEWSVPKVPCIEQLDKLQPPTIPPAYLYTLVLNCLNTFSDGLARFLMPFSVPQEAKLKRRQRPNDGKNGDAPIMESPEGNTGKSTLGRTTSSAKNRTIIASRLPVNPLSLESNACYDQIRSSGHMVDACWPALLAAYSTFLHAALDGEFYRTLVRSMQKFTQVSAILRLSTPRDAFLTALGKNAVPQGVVAAYMHANPASSLDDVSSFKRRQSSLITSEVSPNPSRSSSFETSRHSTDGTSAAMNTRSLLCMRALLNLGIALGPILDNAWFIIFETLQQADVVINNILSQRRPIPNRKASTGNVHESGPSSNTGEISTEIGAVRSATTRLIESCNDLSDDAFRDVLLSLTSLIQDVNGIPLSPLPGPPGPDRRAFTSVVGFSKSVGDTHTIEFVVQTLHELIKLNTSRLLRHDSVKNGWDDILNQLVEITRMRAFNPGTRYRAAEAVSSLVSITATISEPVDQANTVRLRGLLALGQVIRTLYEDNETSNKSSRSCEAEIHRLSLETLTSMLERYGESLTVGWDSVFGIVISIFDENVSNDTTIPETPASRASVRPKSPTLIRPSFGSLELICSDFLASVPSKCVALLIQAVHYFGIQQQDLNISLKSTTLCWNISVYLTHGEGLIKLTSASPNEDQELRKNADFDRLGLHERPVLLRLLTCLVDVTIDPRVEVRNSALHTIFRMLITHGDRVPKNGWTPSVRTIVVQTIAENERAYQESLQTPDTDQAEICASWNSTAALIVDGIANLLEQYISVMLSEPQFDNLWIEIVQQFKSLLDRGSLDLGTAVFKALSKTLSEVIHAELSFASCIDTVWELWLDYKPRQDLGELSKVKKDNQLLLVAYLDCMKDLYVLGSKDVELDLTRLIMERLRSCALVSNLSSYIRDIDSTTPVQSQVLSSIDMLQSDVPGTRSEVIKCISFFISLAYDQHTKMHNHSGPTYVALSKSSMDLLTEHVSKDWNINEVYSSGAMTIAVRALGTPIKLRYEWSIEGKKEITWQKAITNVVALFQRVAATALQFQQQGILDPAFWPEALSTCSAIMAADLSFCNDPLRIAADQDFDIQALEQLKLPLHVALGSDLQSDELRRKHIDSLFQSSIIHEPHPADLPQPGRPFLECIQSKHIGRVKNIPPSRRSKMSYVLLGWLFDLVSLKNSSPESIRLARAAAPYLTLRVGIVLKAYIFDHPLRGLMPQPASQRREMLYLLKKMVELESEPMAFPDNGGIESRHKRHLHALYPLITRAMKVAFRDERVQEALVTVIEAIEEDFT